MPEQRHHGSKRLDRSAEQRQGGREDVLLGECQLKIISTVLQMPSLSSRRVLAFEKSYDDPFI
jgi:hypothetical protein